MSIRLVSRSTWYGTMSYSRPGDVDLHPVGEVAAVGELEAHQRVAGLEQRVVDRRVGLRARVRLDVGVLGAEQLLGAVDRQLLGDVDVLAAAVVALAGIPLGVLVGEHRALALEHRAGARSSPRRSSRASAAGARAPSASTSAISGSTSASGRLKKSGGSSGALTGSTIPAPADRSLGASTAPARTTLQRPSASYSPQVDDRRGRAGQLAAVDDRDRRRRGSLRGTSSSRRGAGPPARLALDCSTGAARAGERRDVDDAQPEGVADRRGRRAGSGRPGSAAAR